MRQPHFTENGSKSDKPPDWLLTPVVFVEPTLKIQKQFMENAAELNQAWTNRVQAEAKIVADFIGKIVSARSIPDAASALQECTQRRLQMIVDDGRRMIDLNEKVMRGSIGLFEISGEGMKVSDQAPDAYCNDRGDLAQMTPEEEVLLLHVME